MEKFYKYYKFQSTKIQQSFHKNNKSSQLSKLKTRNFTEMAGNSNLAKKDGQD